MSNATRNSPQTFAPPSENRPIDLAGDLSGVAHDITQLVELQAQLLLVDVKETKQRLILPIGLVGGGGLLALCALPLLLVASAHLLMLAGLMSWAAYGLVSLVGLVCGGLLAWLGWRSMKDSALVLDRSRAELTRNIEWLKQLLKSRSEAARREARCRS